MKSKLYSWFVEYNSETMGLENLSFAGGDISLSQSCTPAPQEGVVCKIEGVCSGHSASGRTSTSNPLEEVTTRTGVNCGPPLIP